MKNPIIKIVFIYALNMFLFTNFLSGQALTKEYKVCENIDNCIQFYAEQLWKHHNTVYGNRLSALDNVETQLKKKELPNISFNAGKSFASIIVNVGASMGDKFWKKTLKNLPALSTTLKVVDGIYNVHKDKKDYNRIKGNNLILDIIMNLRKNLANQRTHNLNVEELIIQLKKAYDELPSPISPENFIENLEKERQKLEVPSFDLLELDAYQAILSALFSLSDENLGYIKVEMDCLNFGPINDLNINKKNFMAQPETTKISLIIGDKKLSKIIQSRINELVSSSETKYVSVLELEQIHKLIYPSFRYMAKGVQFGKILELSIPIVSTHGKIKKPWDTKDYLFKNKIFFQDVYGHGEILPAASYEAIVLAPYKNIFRQGLSGLSFSKFDKYSVKLD